MNPRLLPVCAAMSVAPLLCVWGTATLAAPPMLKGEYAFSGEAGCISTTIDGFDDNLRVRGNRASLVLFGVNGVRYFNGDGTGSAKGTSVATYLAYTVPSSVGPSGADAQDFQFSFTYTVAPDGKIISEVMPGTFVGTFTDGPRKGHTVRIDKFPLEAMASIDNKTLVLTTPKPAVEIQSFFIDPDVTDPYEVRHRICHRSRTLVWRGP